jgi:hypothetical protein
MTPLNDFFIADLELKNTIASLETVYGKLDPKRPWMAARLKGATRDLVSAAQLCFEQFSACMIFSFNTYEYQIYLNTSAPNLPVKESLELQGFKIRLLNNGEPLSVDELARYHLLTERQDKWSNLFGSILDVEESNGLAEKRRESEARLISATRAFLMSCRAYQDVVYALFLVKSGNNPGVYTSMWKGLKKNGKLSLLLDDLSEYKDWFEKFRALRNLSKEGTTSGVGLGGFDISVNFDDASNDKFVKVGGNSFNFSDLAIALRMSARITTLVIR